MCCTPSPAIILVALNFSQCGIWRHHLLVLPLTGVDSELSAVKTELDRISKDRETRIRQIAFFKSLTKDVSEPTTALVAKLNCETKRENQESFI